MVPETDPAGGGVLSSSHSFLRHEKIARIAEHQFGHEHQRGRHLPAVATALRSEAPAVYENLVASFPDLRPGVGQRFSHHAAARLKREAQIDLKAVASFAGAVWSRSKSAGMVEKAFADFGLTLRPGDKPGVILVIHDAVPIQALHRLLQERSAIVRKEFAHVFQPAAIDQAQRGAGNPSTDPGNPSPAQPSRRDGSRRRRRQPADLAPVLYASGCARDECKLGSTASEDRPDRPDRPRGAGRRAQFRARVSEPSLDKLRIFTEEALSLAPSNMDQWLQWRRDEADRLSRARAECGETHLASAGPSEDLQAALRTANDLVARCQREVQERTLDMQMKSPKGFLRRILAVLWAERASTPTASAQPLQAAQSRLQAAKNLRKAALERVQRDTERRRARMEHQIRSRPARLHDIELRETALRSLTREVDADPSVLFCGFDYIKTRFEKLVGTQAPGTFEPSLKPRIGKL